MEYGLSQQATYVGHEDLVRYCRRINAKLVQKLNIQTAPGKIHGSAHSSTHHVHHTQCIAHQILNAIGC